MPDRRAPSTGSQLRHLAANLVELVQVRLELLTIEAREEVLRIGQIALFGAFTLLLIALGLVFGAVLLTAWFWDTPYRLLAVSLLTAFFMLGGAVCAGIVYARVKEGSALFAGTRDELARDQERLRS